MKSRLLAIGILLPVIFIHCNQTRQQDFPILEGPYLGQEPPGTTPELFAPGFISTGLSEAVCNFSPDGQEVYFNVAYSVDRTAKAYIAESRMVDGTWTPPEFIGFTKLEYVYAYPFLSYDGASLYFISNEPTNDSLLRDEYNIWMSKRQGTEWGDPAPLPSPINGRGITSGPSVSVAGTLYYTLITAKEQAVYSSKFVNGKYSEPVKLPVEVNSTDNQFDGVIAPDESYMLLPVYNKSDSYGKVDLYITFRDDQDKWTPVANMGPIINTKQTESAARISPDGKYIFLTGLYTTHNWGSDSLSYSDALNYFTKPGYGRADIYWISSKIIEEFRPESAD